MSSLQGWDAQGCTPMLLAAVRARPRWAGALQAPAGERRGAPRSPSPALCLVSQQASRALTLGPRPLPGSGEVTRPLCTSSGGSALARESDAPPHGFPAGGSPCPIPHHVRMPRKPHSWEQRQLSRSFIHTHAQSPVNVLFFPPSHFN